VVFSGLEKPISDVHFNFICRCHFFVDFFPNYYVRIINQIHYVSNCTKGLFNEYALNILRHVQLQFAV